jgi:hypothetical protein
LRKEFAERYIRWKSYDWKFKIVFDDEIILSEEQLEDFEECCKLKSKSAYKIWFEQVNRKYDRSVPSLFKMAYDNEQIEFAMFGTTMEGGGWQQ